MMRDGVAGWKMTRTRLSRTSIGGERRTKKAKKKREKREMCAHKEMQERDVGKRTKKRNRSDTDDMKRRNPSDIDRLNVIGEGGEGRRAQQQAGKEEKDGRQCRADKCCTGRRDGRRKR